MTASTTTRASLSRCFLASLGEPAISADDERALELRLKAALEHARAKHPEVQVPDDAFVRHLAARAGPKAPFATDLARLDVAGLYLACGCLQGDESAIRVFRERYGKDMRAKLHAARIDPRVVEDVAQTLEVRLFLGRTSGVPLLAQFSGHGKLHKWLHVSAIREALRAQSQVRREIPWHDVSSDDDVVVDGDPELGLMKRTYQQAFRECFRRAFASLSPKDRNVLRYYYEHRLSIDELGRLFDVHRATAARWVTSIRERLTDGIREELKATLRVSEDELESILRLARSQLEISLRSLEDASVVPDSGARPD